MKQNIGMINALVRITCGFTMLAWATAKLVKRPYRDSYLLVAMMAAMKVAEGIVRFCPVTYLFNEYQDRPQNTKTEKQEESVPKPTTDFDIPEKA